MEFYERYKEIVEDYNKGKDLEDTIKVFEKLYEFVEKLNAEESRAMRENLDEETLAVFDLLRSGKTLTVDELKDVKKVAADTLSRLKAEKLAIQRWRESLQITAQVKTLIIDSLQYLPQRSYTDHEVVEKSELLYQHIYTVYPGGGLLLASA